MTHLDLESLPLLGGQTISLGNDRNDIDDFAEFLHHNNINGSKRVTSGVDKVQAAVDTGVLDVSVTHGGQLFAQVGAVLVLDVFNDRVPANAAKIFGKRKMRPEK